MVTPSTRGDIPSRLVTVREASQILHVHPNTLRKWSDQGLIPSCRIGQRRDRRFAVEDLLAFLEQDRNGTRRLYGPMELSDDPI